VYAQVCVEGCVGLYAKTCAFAHKIVSVRKDNVADRARGGEGGGNDPSKGSECCQRVKHAWSMSRLKEAKSKPTDAPDWSGVSVCLSATMCASKRR